jgi:hypothetical protein
MKKEVKRVVATETSSGCADVAGLDDAECGLPLSDCMGDCDTCSHQVGEDVNIGDTLILYDTDGVMSVELVKSDNN